MTVSKKQQACVSRYRSKHYDHISITVPKGERERYKALAERLGLSVNQLFIQSVERFIEDNIDTLAEPIAPSAPESSTDGAGSTSGAQERLTRL